MISHIYGLLPAVHIGYTNTLYCDNLNKSGTLVSLYLPHFISYNLVTNHGCVHGEIWLIWHFHWKLRLSRLP